MWVACLGTAGARPVAVDVHLLVLLPPASPALHELDRSVLFEAVPHLAGEDNLRNAFASSVTFSRRNLERPRAGRKLPLVEVDHRAPGILVGRGCPGDQLPPRLLLGSGVIHCRDFS